MKQCVQRVDRCGAGDGEIREIGTDAIFARLVNGSAAGQGFEGLIGGLAGGRAVVRCADLVEGSDDASRMLASWSQAGWDQFDARVAELDAIAQGAGIELMIRPGSSGMLSDAICTCSWARRSADLGCSLLLDPVGWIVESMIRDVDDHLQRIAELCQECSKVGAVMIRSVRTDASGSLVEASIGAGEIEPELIADRLGGLARDCSVCVVLDPMDMELLGL